MKIGSLFTGIGGLELGVCDTVTSIAPYGNDIEWIAETDGNALKVLEHSTMFHGVPNLGGMTNVCWASVPDVDCITCDIPARDPCLTNFVKAMKAVKPEYALCCLQDDELYDRLLDELNEANYSTSSVILSASSLGMPHTRNRLFVYAERESSAIPFNKPLVKVRDDNGPVCFPTIGPEPVYNEYPKGYNTLYDVVRWPDEKQRAIFGDAVERWEQTFGSTCPPTVTEGGKPNGVFVEWMMGYPKEWVTGVEGMPNNVTLGLFSRACTPQQASEAFYHGLLQLTRERTN